MALNDILQQECPRLRPVLEEDRDEIIGSWYKRATEELPEYRRAHRDEVRDHLPHYFEALCETLQNPSLTSADPHRKWAIEHGRQRFQNGWELVEVVRDFQILRLVIIEHLGRKLSGEQFRRAMEVLSVLLDDSIAASLKAYVDFRDIQQKQIERYFRRLADLAPVGIFRALEDGQIEYSNQAWCDLVECGLEEQPQRWMDVVHPDDRKSVTEMMHQAERRGVAWGQEFRIKTVHGETVWVTAVIQPVEEEDETGYIGVFRDIRDRKEAERRQHVLMRELDHRVKNIITLISAIAMQAGKTHSDLKTFLPSFQGRLSALAQVHGLMTRGKWQGVEMREMAELALKPFIDGRGEIDGESVILESGPAQAIYMVLYELGTNASKYGSLSTPEGKLEVKWRLEQREEGPWVVLDWREKDGPRASGPRSEGFGTKLIQANVELELHGKVERVYKEVGLEVVLSFPLSKDVHRMSN